MHKSVANKTKIIFDLRPRVKSVNFPKFPKIPQNSNKSRQIQTNLDKSRQIPSNLRQIPTNLDNSRQFPEIPQNTLKYPPNPQVLQNTQDATRYLFRRNNSVSDRIIPFWTKIAQMFTDEQEQEQEQEQQQSYF